MGSLVDNVEVCISIPLPPRPQRTHLVAQIQISAVIERAKGSLRTQRHSKEDGSVTKKMEGYKEDEVAKKMETTVDGSQKKDGRVENERVTEKMEELKRR